jgi:hypothetical protein
MADAYMELKKRECVRAPQRATYCIIPTEPVFVTLTRGTMEVLHENKFGHPFILRMWVHHRQMATLFAVQLFKALEKEYQEKGLEYTIDWWKRPVSSAGPGHLTVAFRYRDFREFTADE